MKEHRQQQRRAYNAPRRAAAAAETRQTIVQAAKHAFEERGWAATTIQSVAASASVSPKTVEALFGTKAALLKTVVDFAIRGDLLDVTVNQRERAAAIDAAADATSMLDLHASHVRAIQARTARIAWSVEVAAPTDSHVAELWNQMTANRLSGVRWATRTYMSKAGADRSIKRTEIENTFWVALEWGTFRSLTDQHGLTVDQFERWLRGYYRRMLLA
ncbi:MAG: TetR/AcrR family transcriptional regulator [Gaiellaceae bacterium]